LTEKALEGGGGGVITEKGEKYGPGKWKKDGSVQMLHRGAAKQWKKRKKNKSGEEGGGL